MKNHFPETFYTVLSCMAEEEIITHMKSRQNSLIVSGTGVEEYRDGSGKMADVLLKQLKQPLFIAAYARQRFYQS